MHLNGTRVFLVGLVGQKDDTKNERIRAWSNQFRDMMMTSWTYKTECPLSTIGVAYQRCPKGTIARISMVL